MIVRNKYFVLQKVKCPNCGSEDTSYYKFNKSMDITSKSKIKCNKCNQIHKLEECVLVKLEVN